MPSRYTAAIPITAPGTAYRTTAMSVALSPGIVNEPALTALMITPSDDRAEQRADERADDAAPEAVGHEDREVPDREAHHHPAEQRHQRDLP